jgi:hypothetical protein
VATSAIRLDPRRVDQDSDADLFIAATMPGVQARLFH